MRIDEINNRINELETSIELLKAIRQDFVENKKEEIFISLNVISHQEKRFLTLFVYLLILKQNPMDI